MLHIKLNLCVFEDFEHIKVYYYAFKLTANNFSILEKN